MRCKSLWILLQSAIPAPNFKRRLTRMNTINTYACRHRDLVSSIRMFPGNPLRPYPHHVSLYFLTATSHPSESYLSPYHPALPSVLCGGLACVNRTDWAPVGTLIASFHGCESVLWSGRVNKLWIQEQEGGKEKEWHMIEGSCRAECRWIFTWM